MASSSNMIGVSEATTIAKHRRCFIPERIGCWLFGWYNCAFSDHQLRHRAWSDSATCFGTISNVHSHLAHQKVRFLKGMRKFLMNRLNRLIAFVAQARPPLHSHGQALDYSWWHSKAWFYLCHLEPQVRQFLSDSKWAWCHLRPAFCWQRTIQYRLAFSMKPPLFFGCRL